MERRKFLLGAGSTAIGSSALVGSGAFSQVSSNRTVSVRTAHDKNAYLGLHEIKDSPNESYVDYKNGHLRIRMDRTNPTDSGNGDSSPPNAGRGVNSRSITKFNKLFKICNQGKQKIAVFVFLTGPKWYRVGLFTHKDGGPKACWGITLDVGECIKLGMITNTGKMKYDGEWKDPVSADTQLINNMWICAVGLEEKMNPSPKVHAEDYVPDDANRGDELPA